MSSTYKFAPRYVRVPKKGTRAIYAPNSMFSHNDIAEGTEVVIEDKGFGPKENRFVTVSVNSTNEQVVVQLRDLVKMK